MFLPLMAERTHQRLTVITYALIAVNVLVHTIVLIQGPELTPVRTFPGGGRPVVIVPERGG
ncbi:MAG: hypothetical protein N2234_00800 [Planctomycetota bacterium]|nr:hypothetical protein [Planctomycetota bacterium]